MNVSVTECVRNMCAVNLWLDREKFIIVTTNDCRSTCWTTAACRTSPSNPTDPSHKTHNASDKYPTMHHFVTEMCTHVPISLTKWCIMGYGTDALWDLCNRSIPGIILHMHRWCYNVTSSLIGWAHIPNDPCNSTPPSPDYWGRNNIFCAWHFDIHFLDLKLLYFDWNFIEICSGGSNW